MAGAVLWMEVMFAVKTGKIIVTAKQMNTAVARKGIRLKSVPRGMEARSPPDERCRALRVVVESLVMALPSEVPFAVGFAAEERVELAWAI